MSRIQKIKTRSKNTYHKVFSSAGSLNYIGKEIFGKTNIKKIEYDINHISVTNLPDISHFAFNNNKKTWIEVEGIHETNVIDTISKKFDFHPLIGEDLLNTTQKPKCEYFENHNQLFVILKVPRFNNATFEIENEHIALVLGTNYLISFQELDSNNVFEPMIERLKKTDSKTRKNKADYLFYTLIDMVVDNYFLVLNEVEEKLNDLEYQILTLAKPEHQNRLFFLKREINFIKKTTLQIKEVINQILRDTNELFSSEVKVYLRDVLDHVIENHEVAETCKEDIENLINNYNSQLSNKMNAVMKTLTVFTSIFMPLTFIVGLYGMNFKYMPELNNPNGYFYTLGGMFVLALGLWIYFKWKKYI
jgi:magnesium transporter